MAFVRAALASPRSVGAVAPSSRRLAAAMVADLPISAGQSVIELGPGTGPFTAALWPKLTEAGLYVGIERDVALVAHLRERFPGLRFEHGSAEQAAAWHAALDLPPVGAILSGLPFASLPTAVQDGVLASVDALLPAGGEFRTFQYVHAAQLPAARRLRRQLGRLLGPPAGQQLVAWNLPPARVLRWRRSDRYTKAAADPAAPATGRDRTTEPLEGADR